MIISTNIISTNKILNESECEDIKNYILTNEQRIKKLGPDTYAGTNKDSLTGRYPYFNFLNEIEISNILLPKFSHLFKTMNLKLPIAIQCWANTFRKNEGIIYHRHGCGPDHVRFICGNIFISGPTIPGTTYEIDGKFTDIENEEGNLTLFYSDLGHLVKPNFSNEVRISMAIDAIEDAVDVYYHEDPNRYFIMRSFDDD